MSTGTARPRPVTPLSILAAELAGIHADVSALPGLPDDLRRRLGRVRDLAAGLDPYVEACTSPESPALAELARRTAATDWSGDWAGDWAGRPPGEAAEAVFLEQEMLSGHVEGETLATLVRLARARRVLEVGMFTGYSALAMAQELPADGELVACELDPGVAAFAAECFAASPAGARIRVEVGPAAATLRRLAAAGECFDLVFVDADKAGYADYLDLVLDGHLLSPHGVIAVDNTLMQGEPYLAGQPGANGRAIADFNARLAADPRVRQVLLPVRDGLTLVRRTPS